MRSFRISNSLFTLFIWALLAFVFILTFYPFWHVLIYSITDPRYPSLGLLAFPKALSLKAYQVIFRSGKLYNAFAVSVLRSTVGPILSLIVTLLVAYPLSIRHLPFRKAFNWYFLLTMYFSAGLIPTYLLYINFKLNNTFWIYIIPSLVNVFGMIIIRTYMEALPLELQESAQIDGAGYSRIFLRIVVPLCLPVMAAVTLFSCVQQWNSYTDTLIYNSMTEKLHTMQYVLVMLVTGLSSPSDFADKMAQMQQYANVPPPPMIVRMAITVVTVVPIAMVYPFLQRYFVKGLLIGSIKG